jgi:hypothetical protein
MDWEALFDNGGADLVGGFLGSAINTRAKNKVIKQQNENAAITGARNASILSQHRAAVREESTSARMRILKAKNKAQATATVNAAVAGVQGGSVDITQFNISRDAAAATFRAQQGAEAELMNIHERAYQNKVNTVLAQQSMISGPNLLGLGLGMLGVHAENEADPQTSEGLGQPTERKKTIFEIL